MRRFILFSSTAILSLTVASQSPLLAQFQEPNRDELQMTSDAKAAGASAVDQQQVVLARDSQAKGN